MIIKKGNITRIIKDSQLAAYTEKGYKPVNQKAAGAKKADGQNEHDNKAGTQKPDGQGEPDDKANAKASAGQIPKGKKSNG